MSDINEIGERIKKLREARGLSQHQLSVALNVTREVVAKWETGTRDLKTAYMVKLADYFNVTCDYILRGIKADINNGEFVNFMEKFIARKKDIKNISEIFEQAPKNVQILVSKLIESHYFMTVTLEKLENDILANGYVSDYKNGENQFGTKKSPEIDIYNTMIKNYSTVTKQLYDMLQNIPEDENEDDFNAF